MRIKKLKYLLAYNNVTKIVADKMNKLEFNFFKGLLHLLSSSSCIEIFDLEFLGTLVVI